MFLSNKNICLETERLTLRPLEENMLDDVLRYVLYNRDYHKDAMPQRPESYYTFDGQRNILNHEQNLSKNSKSFRFYCYDKVTKTLIGDILIGDVKTGMVASCSLGVKIHKNHLRKQYAFEILKTIIDFCFDGIKIHRIEVNILPENRASISLFNKLGFVEEGISRAYFFTGQAWKDQLRFSFLKTDRK